jgi:hypothetical protein
MTTLTFDAGLPDEVIWDDTAGSITARADATAGTANALRFADIDDDQWTSFHLLAQATPSENTLTVRFETSSENNYDYLRIYLDGTDILEPSEPGASGTGAGWEEFSTTLADGAHTITFEYSKDGSVDSGDDTIYFSAITYPPATLPLAPLTSEAEGTFTLKARYWQIFMEGRGEAKPDSGSTLTGGQTTFGYTELAEIQFREIKGGPRLHPVAGGTTFPPYVESGTVPTYGITVLDGAGVDKAFDDDPTTTLRTSNGHFAIGYIFPEPVHIGEVAFTSGNPLFNMFEAFSLQWSTNGERSFPSGGFYDPVTFDSDPQVLATLYGQVDWAEGETRVITAYNDRDDIFAGSVVASGTDKDNAFCAANGMAMMRMSSGYDQSWLKAVMVHNWDARTGIRARAVVYNVDFANFPKPTTLVGSSVVRTFLTPGFNRFEFNPPLELSNSHIQVGIHTDTALTAGMSFTANAENTYNLSVAYSDTPTADITGTVTTLHGSQIPVYGVIGFTPPPVGTGTSALDDLTSEAEGAAFSPVISTPTGTGASTLDDLTSDGNGPGALSAIRQTVTLTGAERRTITLYGTVRRIA